jgi:predicted Zn-ribbon and HTH transcriptional regulator
MPTNPQRLREALTGAPPRSVKELSQQLSLSERDVASALEKLGRSLERGPASLSREAPRCLACGFEFSERTRIARPSRCPECRSERIQPPRFWIENA